MTNRDLALAWQYHDATKHSYHSVRSGGHYLDWSSKPADHKTYIGLEPLPLPAEVRPSGVAALDAIATFEAEAAEAVPTLQQLAQVLYLTAGITRRRRMGHQEILFRAASCTGALYQFELYLVCGDLPELPAGVYHFSAHDMALRRLREGDYRGVLAAATAAEPSVVHAPVSIVFAGTYWRNAWKYRARAYRHFGWDSGTMLANLLAAAVSLELPARVVMGFADDEVNRLLALDAEREVAFAMVPLGRWSAPLPPQRPVPPLELQVQPLSAREVDYPEMREMHAASSLERDEVAVWRGEVPRRAAAATGNQIALEAEASLGQKSGGKPPHSKVEDVIRRRGSTREFARQPISFAQLSLMLDRATRGIPCDFAGGAASQLNHLYVIANAVDGLPPGAYYYRQEQRALETLKTGNFRGNAGYLGLDQDIPADCSAAVFFLADLPDILERFGNRGYRAVQTEAGILGGKLYLAAYAQGLGASGLTFYDDDVTAFFSPHAQGRSAIFLMALGRRSM